MALPANEFSKSLKETPKTKKWTEFWSFATFQYGYTMGTRQLVILRAMSLLTNEWDPERLKKKINQHISESEYHQLLVMSVARGDHKYLTCEI